MEVVVERKEEGALMALKRQEIAFLSLRHFLHMGRRELIMKDGQEGLLSQGKGSVEKHCVRRSSAGP